MTTQIHPGIERMLRDIRWEAEETRAWIGKSELDPRVLEAMRQVPRHAFVPRDLEDCAYDNGPLSIGHGQTISQPYIVALMSDLLATESHHVVLEVGCGSGYQSAVLSRLVKQVYSLEIVPELVQAAQERLSRLGIGNVTVRQGDGYQGWPEHAPFDGIIVTAAAPEIPPPLVAQLKPGGRMVIPVGLPYMRQDLLLVEKSSSGEVTTRNMLAVAFVPLTGNHGAVDE
ncbi:MAG: protein-L-isoaspartate(D-aspartate) O-methyltransferase [Sulfurimicrobium sp.]|nr:protein-L-isoaspartate(D-aspartate) O-methyltransferase [Sulfurimicrobium sp.]MDZ7654693.1 protein-L-isoaspartate(D-aspartate) O-methyltransferase [Sulfurimicrobium sp.]